MCPNNCEQTLFWDAELPGQAHVTGIEFSVVQTPSGRTVQGKNYTSDEGRAGSWARRHIQVFTPTGSHWV